MCVIHSCSDFFIYISIYYFFAHFSHMKMINIALYWGQHCYLLIELVRLNPFIILMPCRHDEVTSVYRVTISRIKESKDLGQRLVTLPCSSGPLSLLGNFFFLPKRNTIRKSFDRFLCRRSANSDNKLQCNTVNIRQTLFTLNSNFYSTLQKVIIK